MCSPRVHKLSRMGDCFLRSARETVHSFINASSTKEVCLQERDHDRFELIGRFAEEILEEGDEVLISLWNTIPIFFLAVKLV